MNKFFLFGVLALLLVSCGNQGAETAHSDHTSDHAAAHAAGEDHSHDESNEVQYTIFNEDVELFIEHTPFVAGENGLLVTHVTHVKDWLPRTAGHVRFAIQKDGNTLSEVTETAPVEEGIYVPFLTFPEPGDWNVEVTVTMERGPSVLMVPGIKVYTSEDEAPHSSHHDEDDEISFSKEQQWRIPFASAPVVSGGLRQSLPAHGVVGPRSGGEAVIHAPANGKLVLKSKAAPHVGERVEKGAVLGAFVPRLAQAQDPARLELALQKAGLKHQFAREEVTRLEGLFKMEAIPQNRLRKAVLEAENARAELDAAQKRLDQTASLQDSGQASAVLIKSPLSGVVVESHFVPGALVAENEALFSIVDMDTIWLTVQIPESQIGRVSEAKEAWFQVDGLDRVFETGQGGRLIGVGGKVHPQTRTIPLIFETPNPNHLLKMGMRVKVGVYGETVTDGLSIPLNALAEEDGMTVAYVQTGGETFERRLLKTGIREGDRIQVVSGVNAGERVVVTGAYQIRLSSMSTAAPDHGHVH